MRGPETRRQTGRASMRETAGVDLDEGSESVSRNRGIGALIRGERQAASTSWKGGWSVTENRSHFAPISPTPAESAARTLIPRPRLGSCRLPARSATEGHASILPGRSAPSTVSNRLPLPKVSRSGARSSLTGAQGGSGQADHGTTLGVGVAELMACTHSVPHGGTAGLPIAQLLDTLQGVSTYYAVSTVDVRGRLAARTPVNVLGWAPQQKIAVSLVHGLVVATRQVNGYLSITRQGHLRLPSAVVRRLRVGVGDRMLLAACPESDLLAAFNMSALDAMAVAYCASLRG